MKLSEVKTHLENLGELTFALPNGETIPAHYHVTEVGEVSKKFIDCGGTMRREEKVNFQLWTADDFDHRLAASKLKNIIELSERKLDLGDHEVEVEYQLETIGKFNLSKTPTGFQLEPQQTACLASESCGIPEQKEKRELSSLGASSQSNCTPGGGCC